MEVLVLGDDKNLRKMWVAARTCYSKKSPIELYQESLNKTDEQLSNFINKVFMRFAFLPIFKFIRSC